MTRLRAGLSGCGPVGRAAVAAARGAADVDVVAAHDADPAALAALQAATPVGFATAHFDDLLGSGVDFVVLAGPPHERLVQVRAAVDQAVPVLLAAPLADGAAAAAGVLDACERDGLRLGVHLAEFGDPIVDQLRQMLADGWFGGLLAVHALRGDDDLLQRPPAAGDPRLGAFAWDGAPVLGLLAADLHLLPWLCGRQIRRVGAQAGKGLLPLPHDRLVVTAELGGGAVATLGATRCRAARALALHGTDGSASLVDDVLVLRGDRAFAGNAFAYDTPGITAVVSAERLAAARRRHGAALEPLACFARWLEDADSYPCPAAQARQDVRALDAIRRALAGAALVDVPR